MKQCTEKSDEKAKFDTTAINTYGTYMRNVKHLQNLKEIKRKSYFWIHSSYRFGI